MSSKAGSTKKRRRIVAMLDESSDDDDDEVEIYSIHSDEEDDDDESSVLEDFEDMWEDPTKKKEPNICTQPPPQQRRQATPVPKVIHAHSPESLAMPSIGHSSAHEKKRPANKTARVSLSPALKLAPGSKVTMLEQVVTEASRKNETVESMEKDAAEKLNEKVKRLKSQDSSAVLHRPNDDKQSAKKDGKKESAESMKASKDEKEVTKVSDTKSSAKKDAVKESTKQTKTSKADDKVATKVSDTKPSAKKDATKSKVGNKPTKASTVDKVTAKGSETKSSSKKDISKEATKSAKATKDDKVATNKGSEAKSSSKKDIATESAKPKNANKDDKTLTAKNSQDTHDSKSNERLTGKRKSNDSPEPPKKKKRTFQDQILFHMLTACKPFTLKSLAQSLQTTDASINWAIISLLDKGLVIKKEFAASKSGRTKELYWANQDSTAKEVLSLLPDPQEIRAAQEECRALQKQNAEVAMEMNVLQQEPGNEELSAQLVELEEAVRALQGRLKATKDRIAQTNMSTKKSATKEKCPHRMKRRINLMRDEWKKRKTKCMDFVDQLADGMEKKPKDAIKLLDLETDEMENVIMPPKHVF